MSRILPILWKKQIVYVAVMNKQRNITESLCMCCVVQEPYPGGKIGAGSCSLFAEYDMTNSYKEWCKMLILFVKELLIDLKWLVNIAECTHLLFLIAKDYRIAYLLGIPHEMKKRTNVHV